ncbi:MAG: FxLYD domain-containing protein [Armatimonadota bacterium]
MNHKSRLLQIRPFAWPMLCLCLSGCLVLGGCPGAAQKGTPADLFISNQRFNIDEDRGLVRVFGRLDNTGAGHFAEVQIHAILRSAGGDKRGENNVTLEDLGPHERRNFAVTVTSHDRVSDVELEVRTPGQP